jgi:MFS family permease
MRGPPAAGDGIRAREEARAAAACEAMGVSTLARNSRLYLAGMVAGDLAYQVLAVAVSWHVFTLRHRAFDLGLVGLVLFLPAFFLALPAGVASDRIDRRALVAGMQLFEAAAIAGFVVAVVHGVRELGAYLAILAFVGTARAFGAPAERSLLPNIFPPERYLQAQATYSSLGQLIVIGGPALGGLLVAISTALALELAAVALTASACLLALLEIVRVVPTEPPSLRDALAGLRFLRSRPVIAGAISLDLFAVLFGGATALLPAFADGIFHLGAPGLGLLRSAPAAGAAVVAAYLARRPPRRHIGALLLGAVASFGVAIALFGLSRNIELSLAMLAIAGGSDMVSVVIRNGLVQLGTPDAMRGRVNAVENVFIGASNELGAFESGTLAAFVGVVPAVVIGGLGTLVVIGFWSVFFPALRRADRIIPEQSPSPAG